MISEIHDEIGRRYAFDMCQNGAQGAQVSMYVGNCGNSHP
jgi:hypothetical protein